MQSQTPAPGATALDPDEAQGLIPGHIHTQADLNLWEEANILEGQRWLLRQVKTKKRVILQEDFVRELHRRMFSDTWRWAGQFRRSDKNIGVEWSHIATREPPRVSWRPPSLRNWSHHESQIEQQVQPIST
jgi:fido (protein-threonine AMPylation protein)